MMQQDEPDDFVLATGETRSVREFLELCLKHAGIPFERSGKGLDEQYIDTRSGKVIVGVDKNYYRPAEVDVLLGDPTKARKKLGWEAKTSLSDLAKIMVEADFALLGVEV